MIPSKKVGIMQPYFFPYIGYFQLINYVDEFIIYDNIKYTKKGWINRNRILNNNHTDFQFITLNIKKDSDYLDIIQRNISSDFNKKKFLNIIRSVYLKSPYFDSTYNLLESCFSYEDDNLFSSLFFYINTIKEFLNINTKIIISSSINIDHSLKSTEKIINICKEQKANEYINSIGGTELYDKFFFKNHNINLSFIKTGEILYNQFNKNFISNLSIIDVLMFNEIKKVKELLNIYSII